MAHYKTTNNKESIVKEPVIALREMYRVLKNTGIALILDMNRNASKQTLREEAAKISKSGFERWFMVNQHIQKMNLVT